MEAAVTLGTLLLHFRENVGMVLLERSFGQRWIWSVSTLGVATVREQPNAKPVLFRGEGHGTTLDPVDGWHVNYVEIVSSCSLKVMLEGIQGRVAQMWTLTTQGVTVTTFIENWTDQRSDIRLLSPGLVTATECSQALLPIYQGILHQTGSYEDVIPPGSHGKHQLGISGLIGQYGALAVMVDLSWEYDLYIQATETLIDCVGYLPRIPLASFETTYTTHFRVCRPTIFDLAQQYREFKLSLNEFVNWEEKMDNTPGLEKMFGAPHVFLGYFESDYNTLEVLQSFSDLGFDRAFVYPTAFRTYRPDVPIRNVPFINLAQIHDDIKALGFHLAPWAWPEELVIDENSSFSSWACLAANDRGEPLPAWKVGKAQWYTVATQAQDQFMRWAQANLWPELTAQHFDVTGNLVSSYYYGAQHVSLRDDVHLRRAMLSYAGSKGPVSTEGFCDGFIESIHCGSVVAFPAWGKQDWWTVPLTSIVYHDSAMHVWWECDSYNNPHHLRQGYRDMHAVPAGGGNPIDQSLLDALHGSPPNIFLAGTMYRPADHVNFGSGATYYKSDFQSDLTRLALSRAKPVAQLHREIGCHQIIGYDILAQDGSVQRTTFKNGTVVTVNFGDREWHDGELCLAGKSWRVSR